MHHLSYRPCPPSPLLGLHYQVVAVSCSQTARSSNVASKCMYPSLLITLPLFSTATPSESQHAHPLVCAGTGNPLTNAAGYEILHSYHPTYVPLKSSLSESTPCHDLLPPNPALLDHFVPRQESEHEVLIHSQLHQVV